jgi:3-dehydroquinate dehydratase-2
MKIGIINGPNLNLLGKREPELYGVRSFEDYLKELKKKFPDTEIHYFQSNVEGDIINKIHEWGFSSEGLIINAGAYTHTSVAIADAVAGIKSKCVEVHISNIFSRESFRHVSFIGSKCVGSISGFGLKSYELALRYFHHD